MELDLHLQGKTAVVTASSRGLGRAVAEQMAAEGVDLVLCSRSRQDVESAADELRQAYGVKASGIQADLSKQESIQMFLDEVGRLHPQIDALLVNSGGPPKAAFMDTTDEQWESAFHTNMMSAVRLIRGIVPMMKHGGRIVTIASTSVKEPIENLVLSNTMRAGVSGLMKTLASELADRRILVNTIAPGRIQTERVQSLDAFDAEQSGRSMESVIQDRLGTIPLHRYGEPQELASVAAFLLSPVNSYITGSTLFVDGGMVKSL